MTTEEIKRAAAEVRDERNESANTATRVGKVLVDLCEAIDAASSEAAATNGATNQLMKKYSEYLEVLKPWLVGKLRKADFKDFAEFNSYMDSLRPDGPLKSGRYRAVVDGVPLFVTYVVLSVANQIAVVWVEGFFNVTINALSVNHKEGFTIASRYFEYNVWHRWRSVRGDWEEALNDLKRNLPTMQTSAFGSKKNYIFSDCNDPMHLALCGHIWIYQHKTDGNMYIRFKNWGANRNEKEESISQVMLPNVSSSQRGLMDKDVFRRINNQTFSEVNSTTDAVNINYTNLGADGNKTLTISKATSAKAGVMTAADRTYLDVLKKWNIGLLGEFKDDAAFNDHLDNHIGSHSLDSGRYVATVGGVPLFVTFVLNHSKTKRAALWVEGSFWLADGKISINSDMGVTIAYRICNNDVWGSWETLRGASNGGTVADVPTVQTSASGNNKNYIYSNSSDAMHLALCGKIWIYRHGTDGNMFLRFKNWGANNDEREEAYSQVMLPNVSNSQRGLMDNDVFRRINNHTLSEVNSTTNEVNINYTNFGAYGNKKLTISKATSAKAGVMTAGQYNDLNQAVKDIASLRARIEALEAK